jgi:hypothetical protein
MQTSTERKVRHLVLWPMGSGILAFVVGVLLGGPDGNTTGIYFGESGLILIAIGTGVLVVWFIISVSSQ